MTALGTHRLEINSIPMHTYAWEIKDNWRLFTMPRIRGNDRLVPGAAGMVPYLRRADITEYTFRMIVVGNVDEDNVAYGDAFEGLLTNIEYLTDNVMKPLASGDGTYTANYYRPGALDDLTTSVHVVQFEPTNAIAPTGNPWAEFQLTISNPSGTWTVIPP